MAKISALDTLTVDADSDNSLHVVDVSETNEMLQNKSLTFGAFAEQINAEFDLFTYKATVNSAEILALNSSPKTIIDSAVLASTEYGLPIFAVVRLNYVSSAYADENEIVLTDGTNEISTTLAILDTGSTKYGILAMKNTADIIKESSIVLKAPDADPTGGGGNLEIWLLYSKFAMQ